MLTYCQLDTWEQNNAKFESKYTDFLQKNVFKNRLQIGGNFVSASMFMKYSQLVAPTMDAESRGQHIKMNTTPIFLKQT